MYTVSFDAWNEDVRRALKDLATRIIEDVLREYKAKIESELRKVAMEFAIDLSSSELVSRRGTELSIVFYDKTQKGEEGA